VPTASPGGACAGTQAYVAIPALGITTDLTSAIPLLSVDTAILDSVTIGGAGTGAGKTTFNPLTFVMRPNAHAVDLFATLTRGSQINEVDVLFVGASGGVQTVCRTITLQTVVVSKLEMQLGPNASGPSGPSDTVTLTYGSVSIADGGKTAGWSVITNGPTS
jgi:type VI protein secretion system component Hcp